MKEKYYTNDVNGDLERAQDRITELEALIRDVAIPALNIGRSCFPSMREAEDKLREAINAKITGC